MKIINYQEAYERLEEGRIVFAFLGTDDAEEERVVMTENLESYEGDDNVTFGYDDIAESEAEEIFELLRDEVKDYLYMFLLSENNPLFSQ